MRRGMFGVRPQPNGRCNDGAVVVLRCEVGDGAKNGGKDMLSRVPPGGSPLDFDLLGKKRSTRFFRGGTTFQAVHENSGGRATVAFLTAVGRTEKAGVMGSLGFSY